MRGHAGRALPGGHTRCEVLGPLKGRHWKAAAQGRGQGWAGSCEGSQFIGVSYEEAGRMATRERADGGEQMAQAGARWGSES